MMQVNNVSFIELTTILISFLLIILTFLLYDLRVMYSSTEKKIKQNFWNLKARRIKLNKMRSKLKEKPKAIRDEEMRHTMMEIQKISKLWRSRRENLKAGMWRRMGVTSKKDEIENDILKEKEKEKKIDAVKELDIQKKRIEELIRQTKIKYRKREIDEESFRDIVKDYQKELMELNIKINELNKK